MPVSALRDEMRVDYPHWATRELLMNAICHRDYEGNGPVQFYQYDDRIEILNPGGLYGKATPENFPYVNDYRNGIVAEGMKVLGFVNRYSKGVQTVQDELNANGNGNAEFKLHLVTAFMVVENISSFANKETNKEVGKKTNKGADEKTNKDADNEVNTEENIEQNRKTNKAAGKKTNKGANKENKIGRQIRIICDMVRTNPHVTYDGLMEAAGIKYSTVYERVKLLKEQGVLTRQGGLYGGMWIIDEESYSNLYTPQDE